MDKEVKKQAHEMNEREIKEQARKEGSQQAESEFQHIFKMFSRNLQENVELKIKNEWLEMQLQQTKSELKQYKDKEKKDMEQKSPSLLCDRSSYKKYYPKK